MISKYLFNQLLSIIVVVFYISIFTWLINTPYLSLIQSILTLLLLVICEHYLLNLVHIASHKGISKNLFVNDLYGNLVAILSGVTLPVFRATHNLHHRFPNDPNRDPDYTISTKGNLWLIATRIFYHDYFFFKNGLYRTKGYLNTYLVSRLLQITIVVAFWVFGTLDVWVFFWLPSILIIGTFYGFFQFYFPHFSTKLIDRWRQNKSNNGFKQVILKLIDFSKYYHFKHHQKINANMYYFPFWSYLRDRFILKRSLTKMVTEVTYH